MKKTKAELKTMANEIVAQYGCFLNVTEGGKVLGINRETARKLVSNLHCAEVGNLNKYYITMCLNLSTNNLYISWTLKSLCGSVVTATEQ